VDVKQQNERALQLLKRKQRSKSTADGGEHGGLERKMLQ